ncbi:hydroxyacid dehydrogenase [Pelagicoccus sp. SDUM812005]|uniref:hydroxyacid dehydrogenase n=1 Tax=Pelagicoccus sp. SDUM812005 TaxID=3041257 RepID=UPI00280C659F|nr:hydroxyacid dehydrogenase [Pelagicoccus sp. SDUM812005]MDQ8179941.1 hydroxyacid dehydrogenase [Pelagicoccus sp. SDUM812005]
MNLKSTNLIVVTQRESETFLREGRLAKMEQLLEPCRVVSAEDCSPQEWESVLREANPEIVVGGWAMRPLPANALSELAPALKYVCYLAGSVRHLVSREQIAAGLLVTNWGNSISRTISECALLLTLSCMRRLTYWAEQMHDKGAWKTPATETQSLFDRRVGLHGFGAIAKELVPLLRPFTSRISAYTEGMPDEVYQEYGVEKADSLEALFANHDVIIEVEALTPARHKIIGEALLRSIPAGGVFVNVARGALVDENALVRVVKSTDLQVGLDVFAIEPLPVDHPLRGCRNVTLLPHLSGPTTDRRIDSADRAIENLQRFREGKPLIAPITCEVYDRST